MIVIFHRKTRKVIEPLPHVTCLKFICMAEHKICSFTWGRSFTWGSTEVGVCSTNTRILINSVSGDFHQKGKKIMNVFLNIIAVLLRMCLMGGTSIAMRKSAYCFTHLGTGRRSHEWPPKAVSFETLFSSVTTGSGANTCGRFSCHKTSGLGLCTCLMSWW